jgi:hypothetical protein
VTSSNPRRLILQGDMFSHRILVYAFAIECPEVDEYRRSGSRD